MLLTETELTSWMPLGLTPDETSLISRVMLQHIMHQGHVPRQQATQHRHTLVHRLEESAGCVSSSCLCAC
jgi:hypothetical protein